MQIKKYWQTSHPLSESEQEIEIKLQSFFFFNMFFCKTALSRMQNTRLELDILLAINIWKKCNITNCRSIHKLTRGDLCCVVKLRDSSFISLSFKNQIKTSLDFNYVKPYLVMWQFDSTIGLMVWEEVLSCL